MFIEFEAIRNARELGGIALPDGKRVKKNVLLRAAHLGVAGAADLAKLEALGLRYVVDFRDPRERERTPDKPVAGAENFPLQALPTFEKREERNKADFVPDFDETFASVYTNLAQGEMARTAYRNFFRLLLEAKGAPVFWHCTQGKDRTGVAAILLLSALGADWSDIEEDYFLSNVGLAPLLEEPMPEHMRAWPEQVRRKLILVRPELLALYLEKLQQRWGGIEGYLRSALGLSDEDFENLRKYYTE